MHDTPDQAETTELKRSIGLPLLVLYGIGVTIGAGIYVLVGATAARAGAHAPAAFVLAALVMAFNAGTFAEFSGRIPQAAGEAAYVASGFNRPWLTLATGLFIVCSAVIAAAAISLGCAGYLALIVPLPGPVLILGIVAAMGLLAAWGVKESVGFAGLMTMIEVAGLLVIIGAGLWQDPAILGRVGASVPPLGDGAALAGVIGASLIAFFAFIGFDDTVNLVEETRNPRRIMPWAIGISLAVVTVIYVLVALVAVNALPLAELAGSEAPIALLFERLTGLPPLSIALIGVVATLNGIVIQIIMGARVLYGLARRGRLPAVFARVDPRTRTPVIATTLIGLAVLALALFVPLDRLAETTSRVILVVFVLVNLALLRVKWRGDPVPEGVFTVPLIVPALGVVANLALLIGPLFIS